MPPKPIGRVAHVDATLVEQIFHISQQLREMDPQHYRKEDYLPSRFEIVKWIKSGYPKRRRNCPARLKLFFSDKNLRGSAARSNRHL